MLRLVVLISGSGSNLQAIIDNCESNNIDAKVVGVISNNSKAFGLKRAKKHKIPAVVIDNKGYKSRKDFDEKLLYEINSFMPDLVVLAGFMRILTSLITSAFKGMMINIHPSLLPKYPGINTHQKVIDNKDHEHGVSIHLVSEELDAGPIIAQAKILVNYNQTIEVLIARIHRAEHILFPKIIGMIASQVIDIKKPLLNENIIYEEYDF